MVDLNYLSETWRKTIAEMAVKQCGLRLRHSLLAKLSYYLLLITYEQLTQKLLVSNWIRLIRALAKIQTWAFSLWLTFVATKQYR